MGGRHTNMYLSVLAREYMIYVKTRKMNLFTVFAGIGRRHALSNLTSPY